MTDTDFRLNRTAEFDQEDHSLAALAGGGFVATWTDWDRDPDADGFSGVYGTVYDRNGFPVSTEFRVATPTSGYQGNSHVVALADGGFAVAWGGEGPNLQGIDDSFVDAFVRLFNADGTPRGPETQISPTDSQDHRVQDIELLADGSIVIVTATSFTRSDYDLIAYRLTSGGVQIGDPVTLRADTDVGRPFAGFSRTPNAELTPLPDGGYAMSWWEFDGPVEIGGDTEYPDRVFVQTFDADGTPRTPSRIVDFPGLEDRRYPEITALPDGTMAVAWSSIDTFNEGQPGAWFRLLDETGRPTSPAVLIDQPQFGEDLDLGDLLYLGGGVTMVTYTNYNEFTSDFPYEYYTVDARLFGPDGRPLDDPFRVTNFTYEDAVDAQAALLETGELIVAWTEGSSLEEDIFARFLDLGDRPGVTLVGNGFSNVLNGSALSDTAFGRRGNDILDGAGGNDTLIGNSGNDRIDGGAGDDVAQGNAGNDTVFGGAGDDFVSGNFGDDLLLGEDGDDAVVGADGADTVRGGAGSDTLVGGRGDDLVSGGDAFDILRGWGGDDTMRGGDARDNLLGGTGDDALYGDGGGDLIVGLAGADLLNGGDGRDTIAGGTGADRIFGGAGDDVIAGAAGPDLISVGTGADVILFRRGEGVDVIDDFDVAEDTLRLYERGFLNRVGDDTRITLDDGDAIVLVGVSDLFAVRDAIELLG